MKVGEQDTELLIDLMRAPTTDRALALELLESVCRTAHAEGVVAGSRTATDMLAKAFDAFGFPQRTLQ